MHGKIARILNVVFGRYLVERVVVVIIIPIQVILPVASIDGLRPGLVHLQQHSAFMSAFTVLAYFYSSELRFCLELGVSSNQNRE